MKMTFVKTLVAAAALAATSAYADTVTYTDAGATQVPNWTDTLLVSQFDSSLGTLNSVTITFSGYNTGTLAVENLSSGGGLMDLAGSATFRLSSSVWNFKGSAVAEHSFDAGGFDGTEDYAGTSGATFENATGSYSNSITLTSASDLSAFIGAGDLSFAVVTTGGSSYSGTGAARVEFHQMAGANVSIQYNYSNSSGVSAVPEPESYALLLAGLAAIGMVKRRRRD